MARHPMIALTTVALIHLAAGHALAADCEQAARYFEQGEQAAAAQVKRDRYQQAVALCPNFVGLYRLGRAQLQLGQARQALDTFTRARTYVKGERNRAFLLGRIGQAYVVLGDPAQAMGPVEQAMGILGVELAPAWLVELRREIDDRTQDMSAEEIRRSLHSLRFMPAPSLHLQVFFRFDSAALEPPGGCQQHQQVTALGQALLGYVQSYQVLVIGHTDVRGGEKYNQKLSERRAQTVVRELGRCFPALKGSLKALGKGKSQLRYPGKSEEDHRRNRRVEVRLVRSTK
jgi:outer membrane protein OmpA-like peptidoglycan-associated protein